MQASNVSTIFRRGNRVVSLDVFYDVEVAEKPVDTFV